MNTTQFDFNPMVEYKRTV